MTSWQKLFSKESIFFLSPDIKRAIGLEDLPNYHLICSYFDPIIPVLRKQKANVFCLEEKIGGQAKNFSNSGKLIEHPLVTAYIDQFSLNKVWLMYFKPSIKLDLIMARKNYLPVGNSSSLNDLFEDKVKFFDFSKKYLKDFTLPGLIGILGKLDFSDLSDNLGLPLVIQFGHGWAGKTTFFITKEKEFIRLAKQFAQTRVKVSQYIKGFTVLNNCCLYQKNVLVSPPALQLSNINKLHPKPTVTCGRQWPVGILSKEQEKIIFNLSHKIGQEIGKAGFKGFFGIDFLVDGKSGKIYLSELNARLTASTPFFTHLEKGLGRVPLLAYHLASFMEKSIPEKILAKENSGIIGSQVIFRNPSFLPKIPPAINFGVFKWQKDTSIPIGSSYFPEKLKELEYIFMRRILPETKTSENEIARIETKSEVLDMPGKLKSWVNSLIGENGLTTE